MKCFKDDDNGYLQWVNTNQKGFVVNTNRQPNPEYLIVHLATCYTITGTPTGGINWTKDYIKICSLDRMELDSCLTILFPASGGLEPCKVCKP